MSSQDKAVDRLVGPAAGEGCRVHRRPAIRSSLRVGGRCTCPLPYGKALVEVANEHFGFVTAESEMAPTPAVVQVAPMEDRMKKLEDSLEAIRGSLAELAGEPRGGCRAVPLPAKKPKKKEKAAGAVAGMDPTTVQAARQAGIPESHLEEMSKILRSRPQKLEDVPRKGALVKPAPSGPLGETEDEGEEDEGVFFALGLPK